MNFDKTESFHKILQILVALFAIIGGLYVFKEFIIRWIEPKPEIILELSDRVNELTAKNNPIAVNEFTPLSDKIRIHLEGSAWLKEKNDGNIVGYHIYINELGGKQREIRLPFFVPGTVGYTSSISEDSYILSLNPEKKYQISLALLPQSITAIHDWVFVQQIYIPHLH